MFISLNTYFDSKSYFHGARFGHNSPPLSLLLPLPPSSFSSFLFSWAPPAPSLFILSIRTITLASSYAYLGTYIER